MAKKKEYKCRWKHCSHPEDLIPENEGVFVGKMLYHKDCFQNKECINKIKDYYYENISSTVVMSYLVKTINTIVFDKKVSPEYLLFAIKYAHEHKMRITNPAGLHWIIDNHRVKDAYMSCKSVSTSPKPIVKCDDEFDFSEPKTPSNIKPRGFGSILR